VPRWLRATYLIDGAGSAAIGVALVLSPGWLSTGLGVATTAPVRWLGAVLVMNGLVNGRVVQALSRRAMLPPIVIDAVFGVTVLAVALADPFGAAVWTRWLAGVTGVLSMDLAVAKASGRSRAPR
jgi:hypothetical protein